MHLNEKKELLFCRKMLKVNDIILHFRIKRKNLENSYKAVDSYFIGGNSLTQFFNALQGIYGFLFTIKFTEQ